MRSTNTVTKHRKSHKHKSKTVENKSKTIENEKLTMTLEDYSKLKEYEAIIEKNKTEININVEKAYVGKGFILIMNGYHELANECYNAAKNIHSQLPKSECSTSSESELEIDESVRKELEAEIVDYDKAFPQSQKTKSTCKLFYKSLTADEIALLKTFTLDLDNLSTNNNKKIKAIYSDLLEMQKDLQSGKMTPKELCRKIESNINRSDIIAYSLPNTATFLNTKKVSEQEDSKHKI